MSGKPYVCVVCKRELDPDSEDVHLYRNGESYCAHCHRELGRWMGAYGIEMEKDE